MQKSAHLLVCNELFVLRSKRLIIFRIGRLACYVQEHALSMFSQLRLSETAVMLLNWKLAATTIIPLLQSFLDSLEDP